MAIEWKPLSPAHIQQLFGKTTSLERPVAFRASEGPWFVVLRGELEAPGSEEETLWWSLCRIEAGECVEMARDYGVEEVDGDVVEVSWDGLFPRDWVEAFTEGRIDWIRMSVTEILENFGETVRHEQPQGWRHRDGRWHLVLVGEIDEETEEEEYAWSLVEETCGEYHEVAVCHPGNDFGESDGELPENVGVEAAAAVETAPPEPPRGAASGAPASDAEDDSLSLGDFLDGWWEEPPFAWAEKTFLRVQATEPQD